MNSRRSILKIIASATCAAAMEIGGLFPKIWKKTAAATPTPVAAKYLYEDIPVVTDYSESAPVYQLAWLNVPEHHKTPAVEIHIA